MFKKYQSKRYIDMAVQNEKTLDLPKKLFKKNFAFTMDFGGSAMKIIYTTEEEDDKIRLHFITFSREQSDAAFIFLEEQCAGKLEAGSELFTCGIGASEYNEKLKQHFDLKFTNTSEGDRMIEGFMFMAQHLPWEDFVQPVSKTAQLHGQLMAEGIAPIMSNSELMGNGIPWKCTEFNKYQERKAAGEEEPVPDQEVHYPCLICVVGSGSGCLQLNEDGSYAILDSITANAGRTFLGLGSILTDAKSFSELCELAGKGDPGNVDIMMDAIKLDPNDEAYPVDVQSFEVRMRAFGFGHAVGKSKSDFQGEDLASALMALIIEPIVVSAYNLAARYNIKQVFFIGGLPCTNPLVQEEFAQKFADLRYINEGEYTCDCHFLKLGSQAGALGALLKSLEVQTETTTEEQAGNTAENTAEKTTENTEENTAGDQVKNAAEMTTENTANVPAENTAEA